MVNCWDNFDLSQVCVLAGKPPESVRQIALSRRSGNDLLEVKTLKCVCTEATLINIEQCF